MATKTLPGWDNSAVCIGVSKQEDYFVFRFDPIGDIDTGFVGDIGTLSIPIKTFKKTFIATKRDIKTFENDTDLKKDYWHHLEQFSYDGENLSCIQSVEEIGHKDPIISKDTLSLSNGIIIPTPPARSLWYRLIASGAKVVEEE